MIGLDNELASQYLAECREHLVTMQTKLLGIEKGGLETDEDRIECAFRAAHSIKGGAGFFGLDKVGELARQTESVLTLMRSHEIAPAPDRVGVLLQATGILHELIQNPGSSNQADVSEILAALARLSAEQPTFGGEVRDYASQQEQHGGKRLRTLVVEDDFASRLMLQSFLSRYGDCHLAVNGREAVEAVRSALERGQEYDLICMDIMMPQMNGREAVRQVRAMEHARGVPPTHGSKIIMTTAVTDIKEVIRCFQELCDSYLMKPIDLRKLFSQLKSYHLIE
jgi:two-component system chemotaxis response regulator CheY